MLIEKRRRDHERIDMILASRVTAEDQAIGGRRSVLDRTADTGQPAELAALPTRGSPEGLAECR